MRRNDNRFTITATPATGRSPGGAHVNISKRLLIGPLVAVVVTLTGVHAAQAEPWTPYTPAELQYLDQLRKVLRASHDPIAFRSDGELLTRGRNVCALDTMGVFGERATFETAAINQLAHIYLCEN
jgi:hypothetical protein